MDPGNSFPFNLVARSFVARGHSCPSQLTSSAVYMNSPTSTTTSIQTRSYTNGAHTSPSWTSRKTSWTSPCKVRPEERGTSRMTTSRRRHPPIQNDHQDHDDDENT